MRILLVFAVVGAVYSGRAAPRKRKANVPPQAPPAQMLRDPTKLDRLLCEAVGGPFSGGAQYSSNLDVEGQKLWLAERNRLCTQQDGEEYDFYVFDTNEMWEEDHNESICDDFFHGQPHHIG